MKQAIIISAILGLILFGMLEAFSEPQQAITNEKAYGVINIEKAPASENKQQIKNTKSWFCINIIVNGKLKDIDSADTDKK